MFLEILVFSFYLVSSACFLGIVFSHFFGDKVVILGRFPLGPGNSEIWVLNNKSQNWVKIVELFNYIPEHGLISTLFAFFQTLNLILNWGVWGIQNWCKSLCVRALLLEWLEAEEDWGSEFSRIEEALTHLCFGHSLNCQSIN